jgi:integrase
MPRRALTDRFCAHAKARGGEAQTDYFDEAVPGLSLRVSRTSRKAWTYHFTWSGRRKRMTLGAYPATSLSSARAQADTAKANLEARKDPRSALSKPETLRAICEEYFDREGAALRTGAFRKTTLERLVYPTLGDRPINDVRRSDVVRLLDAIEDESGPSMADQALAYLRRVFTWHAARSDDFRSPIVRGMARTKPSERARERTLSDEELRTVWKVAEAQGVFGHFVRFILFTGARRNEAAEMAWTEIDKGDWTLPAARNKTKVDLVRPLSKAAIASVPERGGPFVFSTDGVAPISGFSKFKLAFDRAVATELRKHDPERKALANWTLHDLRRTARSLMSRAGVPPDHAERCLGHVIPGVRGVYDRYRYAEEMARAYEALAALVARIVDPQDNVVPLAKRAGE